MGKLGGASRWKAIGLDIGVAVNLSARNLLDLELPDGDFGTGYSSLAYLKRLTIRELKIDRSFVMGMVEDDNDAVIVRSTVELGRNLGLRVVAEGVETLAAWNRLAELGCDIAQGYFLSKPLPAEGLTEWATARRIELDARHTAAV